MVKSSDFSDELESEFVTITLYKKHTTHLEDVKRKTKKNVSQQIRDMIDKDIKCYNNGNY